jgi:hypothetical protein
MAFDAEMTISSSLPWDDRLATVDISPAVEGLSFAEALRRLDVGDDVGAQQLAACRLASSRWAQPELSRGGRPLGPDHPFRQWEALNYAARLHHLARTCQPPQPPESGIAELLAWYAGDGWKVDQAHRFAELARADLGHAGGLDQHITGARQAFEHWVEQVARASTAAVVEGGLDPNGLLRQGEVFSRFVGPARVRTAYVLVDALRFELGVALAERLGTQCQAAVAVAPTITPVGMANLLPGAEDGLVLSFVAADVVPAVRGHPVRTVADRVDLFRRAAGTVLDLDLTDLIGRSDARLAGEVSGADLVVVRSGDIDAAGESGRLGTAWRSVEGVLDDLTNQVLRLGRLGVERVVISADHGFIVLSSPLPTGHVLERPSSGGELHRRCWIGSGGITPDGARRIPLSHLGVGGDLDLVVPEGIGIFPLAGSRQFFHGGLSAQELIVPVISIDVGQPSTSAIAPDVSIAVAGKGITTRVFAATLSFSGSLFASEVVVRVLARTAKGTAPAARLVAGDGYDPRAGTVTVSVEPAVLTFQVTASLERSTPVELQVLDATTGIELARTRVAVIAAVPIDEEWQ